MPVISIFGGTFCNEERVVEKLREHTGYKLFSDAQVIGEASRISGLPANKIVKAFAARDSVFNKFTHEKERSLAYLQLALAGILADDQIIVEGFCGQLIPKDVSHVLRVCLVADTANRISLAKREHNLGENEASKLIRKQDEDRAAWVHSISRAGYPWDPSLYDMVIPTDKTGLDDAVRLITENLKKGVLKPTGRSRKAIDDFLLSATVQMALANEGHHVGVNANMGAVTLTINKHVLMLSRLEEELKAIATKVPGVTAVETRVGPDFHRSDIYRKFDFETPSKVLLVDDEREFVQTLSERLMMRDMGSAVAYDGESALELIKEDEPDVMILDLRMPGIDGIEVLKRVKQTHPGIEVIVLTGHGTDADRDICLKLGAFAYLQKPVDIEELSETIKRAHERIHERKSQDKNG